MAIIANCVQPDVGLPAQTYVHSTLRTNRFPVPPTAWGFIADPEDVWEVAGLEPPYYQMSAIQHEGDYVEPTTGQIWPRIG